MKLTQRIKGILCLALAIMLCLSFSSFAYATESGPKFGDIVYEDEYIVVLFGNPDSPDTPISAEAVAMTRGSDYASIWVSSSSSGNFSINNTHSGTVGITLKVESTSNSSWAYLSVQKPDGSYFKNNIYVDPTTGGGAGWQGTMLFASTGTYKIHYTAYTSVGMRIMCWMY